MKGRKRSRKGRVYRSGYCTFNPHQHPCKGVFEQGANVTPRLRLCACDCHGDLIERYNEMGLELPDYLKPDDELADDEGATESELEAA